MGSWDELQAQDFGVLFTMLILSHINLFSSVCLLFWQLNMHQYDVSLINILLHLKIFWLH